MFANYYVPGLNVAFDVALIATLLLTLAVIPYGKRRKPGTPMTWGEAMVAATYAFGLLFLAYGVVPNQWLLHADNELNWRKDRLVVGPSLGSKHLLEYLPFDVTRQVLRDLVAVTIYAVMLGLQIAMWAWWQKRGAKKSSEVEVSTYGRPLVRKA